MTTGDYPPLNPPDPNFPPPGGFPPPPPGGYPPPPPGYGPPQGYPIPQYGQSGGYPAPPAGYGGQAGSVGTRLLARTIDGFVIALIAVLLSYITSGGDGEMFGYSSLLVMWPIYSGLLAFAYFTAFEGIKGWTPGKKLLGLSVRGPGGTSKPELSQAALRNTFTLVSLIPCMGWFLAPIAYVVILVTTSSSPTKQGMHDKIAGGTQVVKN